MSDDGDNDTRSVNFSEFKNLDTDDKLDYIFLKIRCPIHAAAIMENKKNIEKLTVTVNDLGRKIAYTTGVLAVVMLGVGTAIKLL